MKFADYRAYYNLETARALLLNMLDAQGIPYQLYKDSHRQDVILGKGADFNEVWVQLRPQDFDTVNDILRRDAEERIQAVPNDYYLRELSSKELLDILVSPEEWSIDDTIMARRLLAETGITITDEELLRLQHEHLQKLEVEYLRETEEQRSPYNVTERGNYSLHTKEVSNQTSTGKVLTVLGFIIFILFLLWRFYWDNPLW